METFTLKTDEEFIQLNDLMKVQNWVASGGEAKQFILNEQVQVNGNIEMRIRRKLHRGDKVDFDNNSITIE